MTLLLGPPGSGKSTLLLALAGKLDNKTLKVSHIVVISIYAFWAKSHDATHLHACYCHYHESLSITLKLLFSICDSWSTLLRGEVFYFENSRVHGQSTCFGAISICRFGLINWGSTQHKGQVRSVRTFLPQGSTLVRWTVPQKLTQAFLPRPKDQILKQGRK